MKFFLMLVISCILLAGCGAPDYKSVRLEESNGQLYKISISRWQKSVFTGLLAVERKTDSIRYGLLDTSGIRLFSAEIYPDKKFELINSIKSIEETKLPEYVSLWLKRTMLLEPDELPCSWMGVNSFCLESGRKTARLGTFLHWSVLEIKNKKTYQYDQPFIGVQLSLTAMN